MKSVNSVINYMVSKIDLDKLFQESYTFQYTKHYPYEGETYNVKISVHNIGELVVTSGRLVAGDPLLPPYMYNYFTKSIKPGRYPVIASVAKLQAQQYTNQFEQYDERIAAVMLQISQTIAIKWETADINHYYDVDNAIGSFMDMDAALVLKTLYEVDLFYEIFSNRLYAKFDEFDYFPFNEHKVVAWANILVGNATKANVIAFTAGYGDGGYPSYWGYDKWGKLACLVTDFLLFTKENDG